MEALFYAEGIMRLKFEIESYRPGRGGEGNTRTLILEKEQCFNNAYLKYQNSEKSKSLLLRTMDKLFTQGVARSPVHLKKNAQPLTT
jgi:hypothetical protein